MGKVTILGAGNGGYAYAAYLGKAGHEVCLYEVPEFAAASLDPVRERGGIELIDMMDGFGPVKHLTSDIREALAYSNDVMVVVPAFAHITIAKLCAPYITDQHLIMLNPGCMLGAVEFLKTVRAEGNDSKFIVGETTSNIFACRKKEGARVAVYALKNEMTYGCIPVSRTDEVQKRLSQYFDFMKPLENTILSGLLNFNMVLHPITALLNMGWCETTEGNFDFYWDGMSKGVIRNMEVLDKERIAVGKAMGYEPSNTIDQLHDFYGHAERNNLFDFLTESEVHGGRGPSAPKNMQYRYVAEDVPYNLVLVSQLGKVFGVQTPTFDALIQLASAANGTDYHKTGRTLERLGFADKSGEEIIHYMIYGE